MNLIKVTIEPSVLEIEGLYEEIGFKGSTEDLLDVIEEISYETLGSTENAVYSSKNGVWEVKNGKVLLTRKQTKEEYKTELSNKISKIEKVLENLKKEYAEI